MSIENPRMRARRYAIAAPLLFRVSGSGEWRCGRMLDMSSTGASWRASESLPGPCAEVEFIVPVMPSVGMFGPLVCGIGRVVRLTAGQPGAIDSMAVAIQHSEILRVPARPADAVDGPREPEWHLALRTS